ncbi:leucine-rich repeat extensin-like protein 2 [Carya illinoinensis]|uniref:leucine-rich repeat extensin-like protein 2 n=1 Tax=Carya illinoinensis TaxID=32201 RepID=UPI001C720573|nr:leucine-rich repeat extensin-like protein 2 [Carya illinoinensis]
MDKEEDKRSPRPSTPIPPTQGYYGSGSTYYPPFIMRPNAFPNKYTYTWGSQAPPIPPFPATFIYPSSTSAQESDRMQQTTQSLPMPHFPTMFIYHPSNNAEESGRVPPTSQTPPMPPPPMVFIYPLSTNAEEAGVVQQTNQSPPMPPLPTPFIYPPSMTAKKSSHFQVANQPPPITRPPSSDGEELRSFENSSTTPSTNVTDATFISENETTVGGTSLFSEKNEESEDINEENSDNQ